jgi:PAS domain-containing protein
MVHVPYRGGAPAMINLLGGQVQVMFDTIPQAIDYIRDGRRYIRKDGTPVWAHTTVNLIRDKSGFPVRDFAVIQDINDRKRAEHALRTSKERLRLALDATQPGWWQYDPLRRMISGDTRSQEIFQRSCRRHTH